MKDANIKLKSKNHLKKKLKDNLCKTEKYTVWFSKNYGNFYGGVSGYKTKTEVIKSLRKTIRSWEEFDSILGRMPDRVSSNNLFFGSYEPEITITDVLGIQTLSNWM